MRQALYRRDSHDGVGQQQAATSSTGQAARCLALSACDSKRPCGAGPGREPRTIAARGHPDPEGRERRLPGVSRLPPRFPQPALWGSEYFQAYPSTDRDLGSIAMDHRALRHHSFTSSLERNNLPFSNEEISTQGRSPFRKAGSAAASRALRRRCRCSPQ